MSEQPRKGRDEKSEKTEKRDEKQEKRWEEKWRRDPLNAAAWAFILIWAGVVLLADNLGYLRGFALEAWALFFVGAGVILLLEVLLRLVMPAYRQPVLGTIILAVVFLGIGLGELISWVIIGPLVLIAIGAYLLFRGMFRRRE